MKKRKKSKCEVLKRYQEGRYVNKFKKHELQYNIKIISLTLFQLFYTFLSSALNFLKKMLKKYIV